MGGTYSNVSVTASSGNCNGKTASCGGTLIVQSGVISGTPVTYEGETYNTVVIGTQTWMARNLNYEASGSKCNNCDTYGRHYDWATAMNLPSSCNSSTCASQIGTPHRGICPSGWHIPSDAEWTTLTTFVGSSSGTKLKANSPLWNSGKGTDDFGFAALPGGHGSSGGSSYDVGDFGYWWSASENYANNAYYRSMYYYGGSVGRNYYNKSNYLFSVRCLQD